jgi:hypothetical protein
MSPVSTARAREGALPGEFHLPCSRAGPIVGALVAEARELHLAGSEWMGFSQVKPWPIEIVDLPMNNGDFFPPFFVCLPEGTDWVMGLFNRL